MTVSLASVCKIECILSIVMSCLCFHHFPHLSICAHMCVIGKLWKYLSILSQILSCLCFHMCSIISASFPCFLQYDSTWKCSVSPSFPYLFHSFPCLVQYDSISIISMCHHLTIIFHITLSIISRSHDGSMVLAYMLTWMGYIHGIHGAPYIAAWIRHGI